jgi:energy-coupling factor transporter ATP-binding protein EcfA2
MTKAETIIDWCLARKVAEVLDIDLRESPGANLVLLIGDNANGKSLFRRMVSSWCQQQEKKVECIGLSMEARTGGSFLGVVRGLIYGDEHTAATGANTGRTVTTAIRTAEGRDEPNVVFWDEPDTGLSDAYAADVGRRIADFALVPPKHTYASFVVTHRKALVEQLLRAKPHVLFFGQNPPTTVADWLTRPVEPANLDELYERSHQLFLKVSKQLRE